MPVVVKSHPVCPDQFSEVVITERPYKKAKIAVDEVAYIWASETAGGKGLVMRGLVKAVDSAIIGTGMRLQIRVLGTLSEPSLNIGVLEQHRNSSATDPLAKLARKLYRHSHNKIAELDKDEADFLDQFFQNQLRPPETNERMA